MFSVGTEKDQWHEMGKLQAMTTSVAWNGPITSYGNNSGMKWLKHKTSDIKHGGL